MIEPRATILNVDDQEPQRYVKTRDLRIGGFSVLEATNGAEALRMVEMHKPPIILLDVQLPDINGFDVCQYIKRRWPEIMVLMTSATFTLPEDRAAGLDSGADSFLVQPAEPLELAAAVNALLRIRRAEDEMRDLNNSLERRIRERTADLAEANAKLTAEMAQRERAEAAFIQSQKMEAIGQLTGGLAHDFNNLLTAVVGNLDLIRSRTTEPRIKRMADQAFKAAERGSKLTAQLLAFSRTQKLVTAPVDVNALVAGMRELLNQSIGANIAIKIELAPGPIVAIADANQLELAILNLSINARDAMPDGGTLTITTTAPAADNQSMASISVADTGTGMPPNVLERAFDPFFTTKPTGKGTGLGLSQVYGIVRQSGGDASIASEMGKGTVVTLRLPRTTEMVRSIEQHEVSAASARNSEKLLLVDDDADVREIVRGVLAEFGYDVREATHGEAALAVLNEFRPDLLIVDFAMPGMSGADVVMAARARNEDLKVLFLSGFADSGALDTAVGAAPLLRKPFRPAELATAVRAVLDGSRARSARPVSS